MSEDAARYKDIIDKLLEWYRRLLTDRRHVKERLAELGEIDADISATSSDDPLHAYKRDHPSAAGFEMLITAAWSQIINLNDWTERRLEALGRLNEARCREKATLQEYDLYHREHSQFLKDYEKRQTIQAAQMKQDEVNLEEHAAYYRAHSQSLQDYENLMIQASHMNLDDVEQKDAHGEREAREETDL